jgi:hypothetical protein
MPPEYEYLRAEVRTELGIRSKRTMERSSDYGGSRPTGFADG